MSRLLHSDLEEHGESTAQWHSELCLHSLQDKADNEDKEEA